MNKTMMGKRCKECGEFKSVKSFGTHSRTQDGYQTICRECWSKKSIKSAKKFKNKQLILIKEESCNGVDKPLPPLNPTTIRLADGFTSKTHKVCKECHKLVPKLDYYKHERNSDGLQNLCKTCFVKKYKKSNQLKKCSKCGDMKKHTEFYQNKRKQSGIQSECKQCVKDRYYKKKEMYEEARKVIANTPTETSKILVPEKVDINMVLIESLTMLLDANAKAIAGISERIKIVHGLSKKK